MTSRPISPLALHALVLRAVKENYFTADGERVMLSLSDLALLGVDVSAARAAIAVGLDRFREDSDPLAPPAT